MTETPETTETTENINTKTQKKVLAEYLFLYRQRLEKLNHCRVTCTQLGNILTT